MMKYEAGLDKCDVNYTPLSPVSLVRRTALAYPDYPAIVFDDMTRTWKQVYDRCLKLAGMLRQGGVGKDSTVAVLCRNLPEAVELSYGVPMSGGVLNMINTRLDPTDVAYILDHGEAEIFFIDNGLVDVAKEALAMAEVSPRLIIINDPQVTCELTVSGEEYEDFIAQGPALSDKEIDPEDEWDAVALNYTSGTTAKPKGVVYHHQGAYLAALGEALEWSLPAHPRYLWVLPLFHCNGWCFPWAIAAKAGVNICLRSPVADEILGAIEKEKVTHICGAPIILNMITTYAEDQGIKISPRIQFMTAGAAPPAAVLERADTLGFDVIHVYGLTEVYGPMAVCAWRAEWDALPAEERAAKRARQGINYIVSEEMSVRNPETMREMPLDGETMGEIMFRGNTVMKGYLKDPEATRKAFAGGHFHAGDLGVRHGDGHVEIKDLKKFSSLMFSP
ncbi:MAG: AMP-binding protein [Emcibacter sp.]|nr:AMP-binding protein [Emcibacter sp.]